MNEPLINPWIFYFMDVGCSLKCVFSVSLLIMTVIMTVTLIIAICEESDEESEISKRWRWVKLSIIICLVGSLLWCIIPSRDTILSMVIASYVTPKNIETVGDYTDKTIDKVIEKIIKAAKEMEKKE